VSDARALEANKLAVRRFYAAMNRRDVDEIAQLYAVDARIHVMAPGAFSGELAPSRELTRAFLAAFPELEFEVGAMTAEGDRVAVEAWSRGRRADGTPYRNHYHNLFVLRAGKVALLREYPTGLEEPAEAR
jgi:ketosteroid isomerase-like protein